MNTLNTAKGFISKNIIYTAPKSETIILSLWNKSVSEVTGLTIKSDSKWYNDNATMSVGIGNTDADTVHAISLKAGENLYAWCEVEGAVEYQIS